MNQSFDLESFDKYSKDQWIEQVSRELDEVNPLEKLSWQHQSNLDVLPIYFQEDLGQAEHHTSANGQMECLNLFWCKLPISESEIEALQALSEFYDGLYIENKEGEGLDQKAIEKIPVKKFVLFSNPDISLAEKMVSRTEEAWGNLGYQPFLTGGDAKDSFEKDIAAIYKGRSNKLEKFSIITIPGNHLVAQGGSLTQELGIGLSILVECYDRLGSSEITHEEMMGKIDWFTAVGQDFFHEIAKLNAIQRLVKTVQQAFGFDPVGVNVHAQSSFRYKTSLEDTNNIVRNTTEAAIAIISGCRSISISPHGMGDKDINAIRTALNVGNILKQESFLDHVGNATSGAYYLEVLGDKIASEAWSIFREIESRGGFSQAFQSGWVGSLIDQSKSDQISKMSSGGLNVVGVNKYPSENVGSLPKEVKDFRLAQKYEEL